eukprot:gene8525-213_t
MSPSCARRSPNTAGSFKGSLPVEATPKTADSLSGLTAKGNHKGRGTDPGPDHLWSTAGNVNTIAPHPSTYDPGSTTEGQTSPDLSRMNRSPCLTPPEHRMRTGPSPFPGGSHSRLSKASMLSEATTAGSTPPTPIFSNRKSKNFRLSASPTSASSNRLIANSASLTSNRKRPHMRKTLKLRDTSGVMSTEKENMSVASLRSIPDSGDEVERLFHSMHDDIQCRMNDLQDSNDSLVMQLKIEKLAQEEIQQHHMNLESHNIRLQKERAKLMHMSQDQELRINEMEKSAARKTKKNPWIKGMIFGVLTGASV